MRVILAIWAISIGLAACGGGGDDFCGGACTCANQDECIGGCGDGCDLECHDASLCDVVCDDGCVTTCERVSSCVVDCGLDCDVLCRDLSSCDVVMLSGVVQCERVGGCEVGCRTPDGIVSAIDEGNGRFVCP